MLVQGAGCQQDTAVTASWLGWNEKKIGIKIHFQFLFLSFKTLINYQQLLLFIPWHSHWEEKCSNIHSLQTFFPRDLCSLSPVKVSVSLLLLMVIRNIRGEYRSSVLSQIFILGSSRVSVYGIWPLGLSALDSRKCPVEWFTSRCLSHSVEIRAEILIWCFEMSFTGDLGAPWNNTQNGINVPKLPSDI